jgi:hypothetical protein
LYITHNIVTGVLGGRIEAASTPGQAAASCCACRGGAACRFFPAPQLLQSYNGRYQTGKQPAASGDTRYATQPVPSRTIKVAPLRCEFCDATTENEFLRTTWP